MIHRLSIAPGAARIGPRLHPIVAWYAALVLAGALCTVMIVLAVTAVRPDAAGNIVLDTAHGQSLSLLQRTRWDYDSWVPLLRAAGRASAVPASGPYAVFFEGQAKFQYPPSALLLADLLPGDVVDEALDRWEGSRLQRWNRSVMSLALMATLVLSAMIVLAGARQAGGIPAEQPWTKALLVAVIAVAGLTFFPLLMGFQLGQFQIVLNAVVAASLLAFITGRTGLAGVGLGLCCLIKPQFAILLVWGLLRGERRFAGGVLLVTVPALAVSVLRYGVAIHLEYVQVLRLLTERGEAFWYNQALSGLLHRFIDPASATYFTDLGAPLPPFRAPVHLASTAWALLVLGGALALRPRGQAGDGARAVDLCAALLAATIASPVAWNHHYGVVFPVLATVAPILIWSPQTAQLIAPLGASYLAVGYALTLPGPFFASRWTGLVQSHMFVGGVLLLGILLVARRMLARDGGALPPVADACPLA